MPSAAAAVDTRHEYNWLFNIYIPIALGVFALFTCAIVGAVLWYRRRPVTRAARWHENNPLEAAYAVLLTCVAAFLLYLTFSAEHRVDTASAHERPALTVDVTAARWEWMFHYPAYGITRESGYVGNQSLVVPEGVPIKFRIGSIDVVHSFWIPELRFKRDAIPGNTQAVTLYFDRTGTFSGACAEYCGIHHSEMVFTVVVLSRAKFNRWASEAGASAA